MGIFISLFSFILSFSFILFYLDDFKLSTNKYIKLLQILSPLFLVLLLILSYYDLISHFNSFVFATDPSNNPSNPNINPNVSIGAKVEIGQDAAKEISQGISTLGRNIGMAGTVGAVAAASAKVLSKATIPPVQKVGIVLTSAAVGAGIYVGGTALNTFTNYNSSNSNGSGSTSTNTTTSVDSTASNVSDIVNKLMDDSINSPLKDLIFSIDIINYACLSLIIILFMIISFKYYLNEENIKLNLSNLIGEKMNKNLNYYLIKIIQLNKRTSTIYIYIIFIILFIGLFFNCYFSTELYDNLDKFVEIHINSKK